jgi:hypothetical protein
MTFDTADLGLLGALAALLRRANPIPWGVLADAEATGLRLTAREPRLPAPEVDSAWLLPY